MGKGAFSLLRRRHAAGLHGFAARLPAPQKIPSDIIADFSKQILIGEMNDNSFKDAKAANNNPLYTHCVVDKEGQIGLETSSIGKPDTYCLA